jgi:hypothetical protein
MSNVTACSWLWNEIYVRTDWPPSVSDRNAWTADQAQINRRFKIKGLEIFLNL